MHNIDDDSRNLTTLGHDSRNLTTQVLASKIDMKDQLF